MLHELSRILQTDSLDLGESRTTVLYVVLLSVSRQLNPDTGYLNLRRSFVALACQEGVHFECQRKTESGIGGEGYSSEYAAEVFY